MRKKIGFGTLCVLLLCLFGMSNLAYGQETDVCIALLRDGLRDTYNTVDNASLFTDSRKYFSSDEFTHDYHEGKWNGDIFLTDGTNELTLGVGSSDEQLNEFKKKVVAASSIVVKSKTYTTISKSILNVNLANSFNDCIAINQRFGLSIDAEGEETATIEVRYKPLASGDALPNIASAELVGVIESDRVRILKDVLKPGKKVSNQLSFTAQRTKGAELVVLVNTSNGLSIVKRLEGDDSRGGNNVPIGTVIASMLDFDSFSKLTRSNPEGTGAWSPAKSKWAPCDGRSVAGSKYQVLWAGAAGATVPDMRGSFIRGLNQFDPLENTAVSTEQANPENMKRGQFQKDEVGRHTHEAQGTPTFLKDSGWADYGKGGNRCEPVGVPIIIKENAGKETRPKNVSLYYYIRIN